MKKRIQLLALLAFALLLVALLRQFSGRGNGTQESTTEPRRIVSLAPSCTEIICAVGAMEHLVGITQHCDDPPDIRAAGIPVVAGFDAPNIEQLLAIAPDVVFVSDITSERTVERLLASGLRVVELRGRGLDAIAADIQLTGDVMGEVFGSRARKTVLKFNDVRRRIQKKLQSINIAARKRVLITFGMLATFSAGTDTYADALITEAKGVNVAAAATGRWPQLTMESVIEMNPEVLFITDDRAQTITPAPPEVLARYRADAAWATITAVRQGQMYLINSDLFTIPGPRIVTGLEAVAATLYPDLVTK